MEKGLSRAPSLKNRLPTLNNEAAKRPNNFRRSRLEGDLEKGDQNEMQMYLREKLAFSTRASSSRLFKKCNLMTREAQSHEKTSRRERKLPLHQNLLSCWKSGSIFRYRILNGVPDAGSISVPLVSLASQFHSFEPPRAFTRVHLPQNSIRPLRQTIYRGFSTCTFCHTSV
jgi:hypothetical protein